MIVAALPFVRYVQLINGQAKPLMRDSQVLVFMCTVLVLVSVMTAVLVQLWPQHWGDSLREALFNVTSIITGTGYASADYMQWGPFLISMFFFIGLIGGCAGSTACSIKISAISCFLLRSKCNYAKSDHPTGSLSCAMTNALLMTMC